MPAVALMASASREILFDVFLELIEPLRGPANRHRSALAGYMERARRCVGNCTDDRARECLLCGQCREQPVECRRRHAQQQSARCLRIGDEQLIHLGDARTPGHSGCRCQRTRCSAGHHAAGCELAHVRKQRDRLQSKRGTHAARPQNVAEVAQDAEPGDVGRGALRDAGGRRMAVRRIGRRLLKRGLMIRLLVLPNDIAGIEENLRWIRDDLSPKTAISLMAQYYATNKAATDERYILLSRRISEGEWFQAVSLLEELGMEEGFMQEFESASLYYRPDFTDAEKPFKDIRDFVEGV